jgi:hypothetical protein
MGRAPFRQPRPAMRSLKIFAFDPMLGRSPRTRITIDVKNEPLQRGPRGERIEVIDYDASTRCYYEPIDLEDPAIAMQDGLDPTSGDPRFHQQMVYAVASHVLENFDFALGRRIRFRGNRRLRILPHAFQGANAFYDPSLLALLFGYFRADELDAGPNIPGQTVFTCLSQDIIAHETTHALVDRLRRYFLEPSNGDVAAFHEGFADIVAIFQHFSFPGILRDVIQQKRADLRSESPLVELAAQFGHSRGDGRALRTAISEPDPKMYSKVREPHARGSILVAAVFEAFFVTYQRRISDLIRIATGGTGKLPDGDLHPDLVNRIANEAARTAQQVLTMCIRAFDYLPPTDITFGDFLRALVTADYELAPSDEIGLRAAMIEAFRARGIYARGVGSLAEDALLWEERTDLEGFPIELLPNLLATGAAELDSSTDPRAIGESGPEDEIVDNPAAQEARRDPERAFPAELAETLGWKLHDYAQRHLEPLGLDPGQKVYVEGFHPSFRVAPDGSLKIELIAQFAQKEQGSHERYGGIPFRSGATVIADASGKVRYVISKTATDARREEQAAYVDACDADDPAFAWLDDRARKTRHAARMSFASLHEGGR